MCLAGPNCQDADRPPHIRWLPQERPSPSADVSALSAGSAYIAGMKWSLLAAVLLVSSAAWADADDQDRAMEALERSQVLPLAHLLPKIEARYGARLLAIELHETAKGFIYELEMITPHGKMIEIPVNAATGAVLPAGTGDIDPSDDDTD